MEVATQVQPKGREQDKQEEHMVEMVVSGMPLTEEGAVTRLLEAKHQQKVQSGMKDMYAEESLDLTKVEDRVYLVLMQKKKMKKKNQPLKEDLLDWQMVVQRQQQFQGKDKREKVRNLKVWWKLV